MNWDASQSQSCSTGLQATTKATHIYNKYPNNFDRYHASIRSSCLRRKLPIILISCESQSSFAFRISKEVGAAAYGCWDRVSGSLRDHWNAAVSVINLATQDGHHSHYFLVDVSTQKRRREPSPPLKWSRSCVRVSLIEEMLLGSMPASSERRTSALISIRKQASPSDKKSRPKRLAYAHCAPKALRPLVSSLSHF